MTSEDMVEDPLMSVQIYLKSKVFISRYSPSTAFCFGDEIVRITDC